MAWCKCIATAMAAYEEVQDIIEDDVLLTTEEKQNVNKCGHRNRIKMKEANPEAFQENVDEIRRTIWVYGTRLACLRVVRALARELHEHVRHATHEQLEAGTHCHRLDPMKRSFIIPDGLQGEHQRINQTACEAMRCTVPAGEQTRAHTRECGLCEQRCTRQDRKECKCADTIMGLARQTRRDCLLAQAIGTMYTHLTARKDYFEKKIPEGQGVERQKSQEDIERKRQAMEDDAATVSKGMLEMCHNKSLARERKLED